MTKENLELIALRDTAKKGGEEGKRAAGKFFEIVEPLIQMYVNLTVKYYPNHLTRDDCVQDMRMIAYEMFIEKWNPCISSFRTYFSYGRNRIFNKQKKQVNFISIEETIHDKNDH